MLRRAPPFKLYTRPLSFFLSTHLLLAAAWESAGPNFPLVGYFADCDGERSFGHAGGWSGAAKVDAFFGAAGKFCWARGQFAEGGNYASDATLI